MFFAFPHFDHDAILYRYWTHLVITVILFLRVALSRPMWEDSGANLWIATHSLWSPGIECKIINFLDGVQSTGTETLGVSKTIDNKCLDIINKRGSLAVSIRENKWMRSEAQVILDDWVLLAHTSEKMNRIAYYWLKKSKVSMSHYVPKGGSIIR